MEYFINNETMEVTKCKTFVHSQKEIEMLQFAWSFHDILWRSYIWTASQFSTGS